MTTMTARNTASFHDLVSSIAPRKIGFDLFGVVSGYRAFQVFTHLNARTDAELAALGITRANLPRVAMEAVFEGRDA